MQGFQIPKPSGIPPAGKRAGVPGRPGPQPGARPGLPKPKNPVIAGGKPMVPISNLMQFVPRQVSEEDSENKEGLENGITMPENIESENKGEERNERNAQSKIEDQNNLSRGEEIMTPVKSSGIKEHEKSPLNGKLEDQHSNLLQINGHDADKEKDNDPETRINEISSASKKPQQMQDPEDALFVNKETDPELIQPINHEIMNENKAPAKEEEEEERPPLMSPFSPEKDGLRVVTNTEHGGVGVKSPFGNPFMKKVNSPNPNLSIQKEDIEESDKLNQSPSPLIRNRNLEEQEGRSTQDEQIDSRLHSDPSSGLSHDAKYKDRLDEVIEEYSPMVTQDSNLLFKVKMLELELEKERKERSNIRTQHEGLLQENIELRHQLNETNLKIYGLTKQGGAEKDLARKDEEIRRLKGELKSTMEGSRLVTEHSNRVISESARFKEETGLLLASLEKDKEELHASFLEYKKQIQQEYISKLASMQEKVLYLQEKVQQYEGDLERHHSDLKSKTHIVHKLAQLNNDVQSTLDNWPSFKPIIVEVQVPSILDHELVNTKSPILEASPVENNDHASEVDQVALSEEPIVDNEPQEVQEEEVKEEEAVDIQVADHNWDQNEEQQQDEEGIAMDINVDNGVNVDDDVNVDIDIDIEEQQQPQETPEYAEPEEEYKQEEPVEENQWNAEEPLLIEVGAHVEDQPQELEEQNQIAPEEEEAETRKNIDEDIPAFETNQPESEEAYHQVNEEPVVDIQPEEPKLSVDAFTAPPAYRMPQKKKNAAPQHKPQPVQFIQPVVQQVQPEPEFIEQPPVDEPKPKVDAFTAPPAYRMPQKKKGGSAQPKRQPPAFGFTPAPAQNFEEPVAAQDPEEGGALTISQPEASEENFEKPPMMGSPNKSMSPPKMSTPFGRPPMGMKSTPVKRFVPIDKVQPLQNDVPNGVFSNQPENDEHIELDRTSQTSLDHQSEFVSERKISQDMMSQDEIDIQRPSQGSINNSGSKGKIVPMKAIKKRTPGQGSIYS